MPDPVLTTVWTYLADLIAGISTDAGYRTTVRTVSTDPAQLEALPGPLTPAVVLIYDEEQSQQDASEFVGRDEYRMVFRALTRVDAPGLDTAARIQAYANWRADLRQAIAADVTCGGVAYDARITAGTGPEMDAGRILSRHDITVWAEVGDDES